MDNYGWLFHEKLDPILWFFINTFWQLHCFTNTLATLATVIITYFKKIINVFFLYIFTVFFFISKYYFSVNFFSYFIFKDFSLFLKICSPFSKTFHRQYKHRHFRIDQIEFIVAGREFLFYWTSKNVKISLH